MKEILEQWDGKFKLGDEVHINLDDFNPKDGDEFHIELLSKRRKLDDEDLLSAE